MSQQIPVIIINYRNPENTLKCLASLRKSTIAEQLIPIIVDSGQERGWAQALEEQYPDWTVYLPQEENLGFSGANNVGIEYVIDNLSAEFLVLLNDDTTVAPGAVAQLITTLHENKRAAASVPKIYFSKGKEFYPHYKQDELGQIFWYGGGVIDWKEVIGFHRAVDEVDHSQYDTIGSTEFVTGCCVALRIKSLKEVGIFDDRYFLYLEDLDLSCRLLAKGWKLLYDPEAHIWHDNAGSSGSGSNLHEYYFVRNRYLFGFRYAPLRTKLFLLKHLVIQWQQGSAITKQAVRDFLTGTYGKRDALHQ